MEYLEAAPPEFNGGRIALSWLKANFEVLNENASDDELEDSWGATVLAFLFREMCRATNYKKTAIGGYLLLLQSWAWFCMPFLCPIVNEPSWSMKRKNHRDIPTGLEEIRLLIDTKAGSEFQWISYVSDEVKACIPPHLSGSLNVWMSVVPLTCYAIVEWHPVDRVLHQFFCTQYIPGAPRNLDDMHNIDRRGKKEVKWVKHEGLAFLGAERDVHRLNIIVPRLVDGEKALPGYIPSLPAYIPSPLGYMPSPQGFMIPYGVKYCKPVVQIDGTFLYGKYKQVLLLVVVQDGNHNILPIAFALVQGEDTESWAFFLKNLRLHVVTREQVCIISDRGAGIKATMDSLGPMWKPPHVQHRYCVRHIAANYYEKYKKNDERQLVMPMGLSLCYKSCLEKNKKGCEYIMDISKEMWTNAYDGGIVMDGKIGSLEYKQDLANAGVWCLCDMVGGKKANMPEALQEQFKLSGKSRALLTSGTPTPKGLKDIAYILSVSKKYSGRDDIDNLDEEPRSLQMFDS
ncbi:SsDNA-binding transcriptional regulator isoform 1 [Hibiscus syriacus]|uniref:SsDNA-binding transcriptional regulator isoform 1 n=1 Tax=Hibiscus syriacus TaxID=106335 RepID=A0A6A3CRH9_HIBSY|nr:SsDNA-binding transcriptional regulator isoform 1 [Hibiscus syriacus]